MKKAISLLLALSALLLCLVGCDSNKKSISGHPIQFRKHGNHLIHIPDPGAMIIQVQAFSPFISAIPTVLPPAAP
jgi:hypothetical protein